jgi:tetratricopeptide (TPR) repeat protein
VRPGLEPSRREAVASAKIDAAALILRSQQLVDHDEWGSEALDVNQALAQRFPMSADVQLRLAHCLVEASSLSDGLRAYKAAVELAIPKSATARIAQRKLAEVEQRVEASRVGHFDTAQQRALIHKDAARTDEALVWHERAVGLARTGEQTTKALGSWAATLRGLRRFEEAHELLLRSISIDPSRQSNRLGYTVLIATLTDLGRLRRAVAEADDLLKVHPNDSAVLNASGRAFFALAKKTADSSLHQRASACFARGR